MDQQETAETEQEANQPRICRRALLVGGSTTAGAVLIPGSAAASIHVKITNIQAAGDSGPKMSGDEIIFRISIFNLWYRTRSFKAELYVYDDQPDPYRGSRAIQISPARRGHVELFDTPEVDETRRVQFKARVEHQDGSLMGEDTVNLQIQKPPLSIPEDGEPIPT